MFQTRTQLIQNSYKYWQIDNQFLNAQSFSNFSKVSQSFSKLLKTLNYMNWPTNRQFLTQNYSPQNQTDIHKYTISMYNWFLKNKDIHSIQMYRFCAWNTMTYTRFIIQSRACKTKTYTMSNIQSRACKIMQYRSTEYDIQIYIQSSL